ncbi:hypothetical protein SAMN05421504_112190 [Amycolatopsis xylanica]|uniref:AbiTii domain-containing protein n=1 Tax=Amycolatopsis xylanica TaxID=589385 RepID=A0A1H3S3X7_9PSEU|nr:hypothetical protein [Amycolatopsis xylanica]SDZ32285.1 hypothetical protein SAMN05421504_112190 [Amycolatopsis xylanica]
MGQLQQIVADAMDGEKPVSQLLRAVQVLAVRGDVDDLAEWVKKERDGYAAGEAIPRYRGPDIAHVYANLNGPYGASATNMLLPESLFPEDFAKMFRFEFRQPIAELEALIKSDQDKLEAPWSGNAIAWVNSQIDRGEVTLIEGMYLASARRVVSVGRVISVIDAVRNRILDLALELEKVAPRLDEANVQAVAEREQVSAVFQTIVNAENAYVGNNQTAVHYEVQVIPGDTESLTRFLEGIRGASEDDKLELIAAAEAAREAGPDAVEEDSRLMAAMKKVGSVAGKIGQEAAGVALKLALQRWLGGS